jgi:hypothetical protein
MLIPANLISRPLCFQTFRMPTVQQLWETANNMTASQQAGTNTQTTQLPPTTDLGTLAARRCVELGGSALQCLGGGLSEGMKTMIGVNTDALTGSGVTGLVIFGTYNSASGLRFNFGDGNVDIGNCGQMVQGGHTYTVGAAGGKLAIKINNQPQQLLVSLGTDEKITGPVAQQITGQKITGYEVVTNLKTGASTRNPIYGPDTENCKVGTLSPGPATAPDQGLLADFGNALTAAAELAGMAPASSEPKLDLISPGPRMVGVYTGSGGLKIQFQDANAVIDCAQAHVMVPYDVSLQGGAVTITVKNGTSPFNLTWQANGSLAGAGSATINGKLMTGMDDSGTPILAPASASCTVGTLAAAK